MGGREGVGGWVGGREGGWVVSGEGEGGCGWVGGWVGGRVGGREGGWVGGKWGGGEKERSVRERGDKQIKQKGGCSKWC